MIVALMTAIWASFFAATLFGDVAPRPSNLSAQWIAVILLHLPYILILAFLVFGLGERIGFYFNGRSPAQPGRLPTELPSVCIQLPMFNEQAVVGRAIEAAAAQQWPRDRLVIQVLDDSTDIAIRDKVEAICTGVQQRTGVTIHFIHRQDRQGYKAGALEAGRRQTEAEFIAIFDADFVPPPDYLARAIPHFYDAAGLPVADLALVQAQWGHLNDDESFLTAAQALWVDDHHTLQQSWRSAALDFVNFTGTAGVWRAAAIEAVGGWRSASLVEDCEISFRVLFAGYRTKFVKEIVAPAELPQTFDAYRLQQKRWTQGWVQLQRLHLPTLLFRYRTGWLRKAYLCYVMCISWQWPLWLSWIAIFPFLIANGLSLASFGTEVAVLAYAGPPMAFAVFSALVAALETKHTYVDRSGRVRIAIFRRFARMVPFMIVNAGMLAHHVCAFIEGMFGPMHAEFERTPKTASVTAVLPGAVTAAPSAASRKTNRRQVRPAYLTTEVLLLATQCSWMTLFAIKGLGLAALGAGWLAACLLTTRIAPHAYAFMQRASLVGKPAAR